MSYLCLKCESASRCFQPGEGLSRGLLSDCENRWIVCSSSSNLENVQVHVQWSAVQTSIDVVITAAAVSVINVAVFRSAVPGPQW